MISYAQNAEDVVLARAFTGKKDGFWVDVGANEPTHDSVTRHFYDLGWTGINIEPQVSCIRRLHDERPRDLNLNVGIGLSAGRLAFYLVPDAPGMSTFSENHAELVRSMGYRTQQLEVDVRTLNDVFAEHVEEREVDFLKVDVEGLEAEVLGAFDLERWRPRVILVESSPSVDEWEERLLKLGYRRTLWDGINLFFVREEDAAVLGEALSVPATIVLDRFDPWYYVQQLDKVRRNISKLFAELLIGEFCRPDSSAPRSEQACVVLAEVLSERQDVVDHFVTPRDWDVTGLMQWAATAHERSDEAHGEKLVPYTSVYAEMLAARAELRPATTTATSRIRRAVSRVARQIRRI